MIDHKTLAFPIGDARGALDTGMTLRDYFAAKVLNGLLVTGESAPPTLEQFDAISHYAYLFADSMMKEREK